MPQRSRNASGGIQSVPRLVPRANALLQLFDDERSDAAVNINAGCRDSGGHEEPCDPILPKRKAHKAISRGGSLGGRTVDCDILNGWVVRNVERLIEELDYHDVLTERVILMLEGDDDSWAAKADLCPTASFDVLCKSVKRLLSFAPRFVVSHMHLLAEKLMPRSCVQKILFPEEEDSVAGVKAMINGQIGRFVLRSGDTLRLPAIYRDGTNDYDICDVRDK